jgi:hypothetical protein
MKLIEYLKKIFRIEKVAKNCPWMAKIQATERITYLFGTNTDQIFSHSPCEKILKPFMNDFKHFLQF